MPLFTVRKQFDNYERKKWGIEMENEVNGRLIVAADFDPIPEGVSDVRDKVLRLADNLKDSGVIIKVNSILRATGYSLIAELHDAGLKVMADLKLIDIPQTMQFDGAMLRQYAPEFLTVMCSVGIDGMSRVRAGVGAATQVVGVTVLTSLDEEESQAIFGLSTKAGVLQFARMAQLAGLEALVLSPQEAAMLQKHSELELDLITPGIRPEWSQVLGDDQKRVMTPGEAIQAGVKRIVVGRPITQADNPRDAVERTLEEIASALKA